jgi:hypothetical protein
MEKGIRQSSSSWAVALWEDDEAYCIFPEDTYRASFSKIKVQCVLCARFCASCVQYRQEDSVCPVDRSSQAEGRCQTGGLNAVKEGYAGAVGPQMGPLVLAWVDRGQVNGKGTSQRKWHRSWAWGLRNERRNSSGYQCLITLWETGMMKTENLPWPQCQCLSQEQCQRSFRCIVGEERV